METQEKKEREKMSSNAKPCNAKKTSVDGIQFDSRYESEVFEILRNKIRRMNNQYLKILVHHPIHFTGGKVPVRVCQRPTWKVDFAVIDVSKSNAPICAIEAKGRFFDQDKYKFIFWDLYQEIPLIVVYQGTKPPGLLNNGWLTFLPTFVFKNLDLAAQVNHKNKSNRSRR